MLNIKDSTLGQVLLRRVPANEQERIGRDAERKALNAGAPLSEDLRMRLGKAIYVVELLKRAVVDSDLRRRLGLEGLDGQDPEIKLRDADASVRLVEALEAAEGRR